MEEVRLDSFRTDLRELTAKQVACKYLLGGNSAVLSEHSFFEIRDRVASHFCVEFSEVVVVGSAKVGFSIAPTKRYREFCDDSDIDVAVISERLFTRVWREAYAYQQSRADWPKARDFFKYLVHGWIRPDKLPNSDTFEFTSDWWSFFNELSGTQEFGPYKVRGGLYHSWFFFFQYQMKCIEDCAGEQL